MVYTNYSSFYEYVLPEVHGCPKGIAKNAIRDAVIEFCTKARIWTAPSQLSDVVANENRYYLDSRLSNANIATITYADINETPLVLVSMMELEEVNPSWRYQTGSRPNTCFMDTNNTIRLVGTPTETIPNSLYVEVALKPTRDSEECPEFIFDNWAETIAHGALSRLKSMVGRGWADAAMVPYHRDEFRAGISRAKSNVQKSGQTLSRTIKAKSFMGI